MRDFISGFRYPFTGFDLILKPGIRLYVLIPLLINTFLFAGVITYGAHLLNGFIESFLTGWWEWLRWLLWPLFIIISLTIIFFCFSIVANLIAAPFNGFLAEAAEVHLTGTTLSDTTSIKQLPGEITKAVKSEFKIHLFPHPCGTIVIVVYYPFRTNRRPAFMVYFWSMDACA